MAAELFIPYCGAVWDFFVNKVLHHFVCPQLLPLNLQLRSQLSVTRAQATTLWYFQHDIKPFS